MKKFVMVFAAVAAMMTGAIADEAAPEVAVAVVAEEEAPKTLADFETAKAYIEAYADNVQNDKNFKENKATALATIRSKMRFFGTWWALVPPLLAIALALLTKKVYFSLLAGIMTGILINFKEAFAHITSDPVNFGILLFLVFLGVLVAMMNKTGASAAFGRWAASNIKSRVGVQIATIILGLLIFVDDYFNCLTVGAVMKPITDAKKVSRAKLAYIIDSTAAPICIIAPISSWAAAVSSFATGAGAESGFALFVSTIPYNYYAILTIIALFFFAVMKLDFGPMKRHEEAVLAGQPDKSALDIAVAALPNNPRGRVIDMLIPVMLLVVCCISGMLQSGGYFGEDNPGFVKAFSDSNASVGLMCGSIVAIAFTIAFYLGRRVISFRDCMVAFPQGLKAMAPAILILCFAWTLKAITDSLGAKVFISDLINGPVAALAHFLPAIIFAVSIFLAFATGTSWGTFAILIPIVLVAVPISSMTIIAVSACLAGAVCGDHCSPISDTTIMSSAGAQCNHIVHVHTQLPYAFTVAAVSFAAYVAAPFIGNVWISLAVAIAMLLVTLFVMKAIMSKK